MRVTINYQNPNDKKCKTKQIAVKLTNNQLSKVCLHTSQDSFYKWTKISSLEINIFELKNDGEKWSRIYFEIDRAPSELLLPSAKKSAQKG